MRHTISRAAVGVLICTLALATACSKSKTGTTPSPGPTGPFGAAKDAAIAALVPSNLAAKGTLKVATDASYPPDEFFDTDNKTIIGMSVDLGHAIAAVLGLKFEFVNATFDTIIPGLASGKFDLGISSFTDNKEREKVVDFVTYFQAGASIFVSASTNNSFKTLADLCGKTVAVERGTTQADDVGAQQPKCTAAGKQKINLLQFDDQNAANLAVTNGRAVAGLADSQVASYQEKVTGGKVKVTGDYLEPAPYGIALPRPKDAAPGTGPLTKAVLDAVQKLFDTGVYRQILDKWGIAAGAITAPKINAAAG